MTAAAIRMQLRDVVPDVLRRDGRSAKQLARDAGVTPRAIEAIRQEEHLPSVPTFLALAREIPELKAEILRWLELRADNDPETERLAIEIGKAAMRMVELRAERLKKEVTPNGGA